MTQPTIQVKDAAAVTRTVFTINPNGQAAAADSQPVVLASDQSPIPVTVGSIALPTGAATETTLAGVLTNTQLRASAVPVSAAALPLPTGAATETTVSGLLTNTQLRATAVPVSATALPLPTGAATETTSAAILAKLIAAPATEATVGGLLTNTQLRASAVPVSAAALPLPTGAATEATLSNVLTNTQLRASAVPVSAAALPLPTGASTETTSAAILAKLIAAPATEATVGGLLTNTQLRASAVPVSAAALPLPTGAATEATVGGLLTNTQLRATAVPVSVSSIALPTGASTEATLASILAKLIAAPATEATLAGLLTNTQLRASAVPVSAAALPLPTGAATEATLAGLSTKIAALGQATMAGSQPVTIASNQSAIPVTGTFSATPPVDSTPATATITAQDSASTSTAMANGQLFITGAPTAGSFASFTLTSQEAGIVQVTGTWTGTLNTEVSLDGGTTWFPRNVHQAGTDYVQKTFTNNFAGGLNAAGYTNFRVRASAAWTGTATVKLIVSANINSVFVNNALRLTDPTVSTQILAISAAGAAKVDGSATTQPVSASSLPLPTGAATETSLSGLNAKIPAQVNSTIPTSPAGIPIVGFYPGVLASPSTSVTGLLVDEFGSLYTRGGVTTDEASFRINNAGAAVGRALPGTPTWTNGSATVTGSGFLSSTVPILFGDYVKQNSDPESAYAQVLAVTNTTITLRSTYTGANGTSAGTFTNYATVTGSGGSITVSSGNLVLTSGATNSANTNVSRRVDYGPLAFTLGLSISQRIANQDVVAGFDTPALDSRYFARFRFTGATNTVVLCETGWAGTAPATGTDLLSASVTLPNGLTSATVADYRIELDPRAVYFYINDILVATNRTVAPRPYDVMSVYVAAINGTGASTTTVTVPYAVCTNYDSLRVSPAGQTDVISAQNVAQQDFAYSVAGVITINTDLLIIDCSQLRHLTIQCVAMGTTGVVTPSFSNDGGTTWAGASIATLAGTISTTFNAAGTFTTPVQGRLCRLRLTTATTAATTTIRVAGQQQVQTDFVAILGTPAVTVSSGTVTTVSTVTAVTSLSQIAGNVPLMTSTNGATNKALGVQVAGPTAVTDYSAQAWAAASGSGATIADASGSGAAVAFDISVTAWTAGASTGLTVFLQESPDNGTTWFDIWQTETVAAVAHVRIPAIPIAGRRRMRWVNVGGAATTATVTVTAMDLSVPVTKMVQWFDRTASVGSGTAAATTNSAAYDIAGMKALTVLLNSGTATAVASFKVQMSMDNVNWYDASAATAVSSTSASLTLIPLTSGVLGRFIRVQCTATGTTQLMNHIAIYGTN